MKNLISVILPTFNEGKYLSEALDSIINQTFSDFEIIVIDDGSVDNTQGILKNYLKKDRRIRVIRNESNLGIANSLNIGIMEAKNEWIARMDGDDISYPQRFEKQINYLSNHPEIDVLSTGIEGINETGGVLFRKTLPEKHSLLCWETPFALAAFHGTVMMRTNKVRSVGGYSQEALLEDVELWTRLIQIARFATIPDILYQYRRSRDELKQKIQKRKELSNTIYRKYISRILGRNISENLYSNLRLSYYPNKIIKLSDTEVSESLILLYEIFQYFNKNNIFIEEELPLLYKNISLKTQNLIGHSNCISHGLYEAVFNKTNKNDLIKADISENRMIKLFKKAWFFISHPLSLVKKIKQEITINKKQMAMIRTSGFFDKNWYLEKNPDVAKEKGDPCKHYLLYGGFEGRDPGPNFNSGRYLEVNADVKNDGANPLLHYLEYGKNEGRLAK